MYPEVLELLLPQKSTGINILITKFYKYLKIDEIYPHLGFHTFSVFLKYYVIINPIFKKRHTKKCRMQPFYLNMPQECPRFCPSSTKHATLPFDTDSSASSVQAIWHTLGKAGHEPMVVSLDQFVRFHIHVKFQ